MYHALHEDGNVAHIDQEDRPYAVSRSVFARQLDEIQSTKVSLFAHSAGECPDTVITFDDGHVSNLSVAAPMLLERNLSAYFFISTDFIDKRAGFLSADQVAELSHLPGMCIGSHGVSHRFFDDMSLTEVRQELEQSRDQLQTMTGSMITSLSFPGGRFDQHSLDAVRAAGYKQWFGSQIGPVVLSGLDLSTLPDSEDRWHLLRQRQVMPIMRCAIRRDMPLEEFRRIIQKDKNYFRQKKRLSHIKTAARRILGNRVYHGLYKSLSRR